MSVAEEPQASAIAWCGTLNNYSIDEIVEFKAFCDEHCSYWIFQKERGESGTPHLQAYICLLRKGRLSFMRRRLSERWHWETRKGSHTQARDYCEKEDSREPGTEPEWGGVEPKQGNRSDIAEFVQAVTAGQSDLQLLETYPVQFLLHYSKLQRIRDVKRKKEPYEKPEVNVYYGPTGTGKSRAVHDALGESGWWKAIPGQGLWFDGYDGQPVVWFDDYRGEIGYSLLLNILDGYGTRVQVKGSSVWFKPQKIYFTSNIEPYKWYQWNETELYAPLERRITNLVEYLDHSGATRVHLPRP